MPSWVSSRWASPSIPLSRESKASADWPAVDRAAADTASARWRSLAVRPSASCSFPAASRGLLWVADRLGLDIFTQLQDPGHDRPGDLVDRAGEPCVVVATGFRVEMEGHYLRLGD